LPQRTSQNLKNYIVFEQFQIELPPDWIGIILAPTGIDPVGASQYPKVSCRRKRLHAPEGESDA